MKLWEVLKALDEGSKSSYEHSSGDSPSIVILEKYTDGWQEVKQPVTWMEALGAWALEGKTVRCVIGYSDYIFDGSSNHLEDVLGSMTRKQIKEGTWYIEEETK